jgi:autotransporter-associated beta strand protein
MDRQRRSAGTRWTAVLAAAVLAMGGIVPGRGAEAAAAARLTAVDVTVAIRADRDIVLTGDAVVRLTGGTVTYDGVLSGQGTFTVGGTGTLVLTKDSDFTLPAARRRQKVVTYNGSHPLTRVDDPDPPAVTVDQGATLQYGDGTGTTGQIGHYVAVPGLSWNTLNHRIDGTLDVAVHSQVHLGIMSGSGLILARRFTWPGLSLAGNHPFTGTIYNGTGFAYGSVNFTTELPGVKKIVNQGSAIHSAADGVTTIASADYYSQSYGNDINYHTWGSGLVRNTGVYSWSDSGSDRDPALSDPALNYADVPHQDNARGVNIEGADVEWGDGTTDRFFLPGNVHTAYINMHADSSGRSKLTLDYDGPVTLGLPISGGIYHDTLSAPGRGDVVIAATKGNAVTFTAPQNYDGSTTIGRGASLRLGDGTAGGDSSLLRSSRYRIIDDGALTVQNTAKSASLSRIGGAGSLTQAGAATLVLTGATTFRGATVIGKGTLKLTAGSLASSSGVSLTRAGAVLDLTGAGNQTLKRLAGAAGTTVRLGGALTVGDATSTTFAGDLAGSASMIKVGTGTLTLSGTASVPLSVRAGTLELATSVRASIAVGGPATVTGTGTIGGAVTNSGTMTGARVRITGAYTQKPGAVLDSSILSVHGAVTLAGRLNLGDLGSGPTTLIDNTGTGPVHGTFDGFAEGANVNGRTISYAGGDGNDVVLSAALAGAATPGKSGRNPVTALRAATSSQSALGILIAALVLAAAGTAIVVIRRRKPSLAGRHR